MRNVIIRCYKCSKEIFNGMKEWTQKSTSIYEANNALCSDCHLERATEEFLKD